MSSRPSRFETGSLSTRRYGICFGTTPGHYSRTSIETTVTTPPVSTCWRLIRGRYSVPMLVITEVAYLVETRLGTEAEVRFLADLAEGNPIAAAERLKVREVATLNRGHFMVVRPANGPFTLLP
jgi:hypothetical protein